MSAAELSPERSRDGGSVCTGGALIPTSAACFWSPGSSCTERDATAVCRGGLLARFGVKWNGVGVTPFTAIDYANLSSSSFNEGSNTGALSLTTAGHTAQSAPLFEGARFDGHSGFDNDTTLTSHVSLAYMHNFSTSRTLTESFASLPSAQFTVDGARAPANAFDAKVGVDYQMKPGVSLFASFDGRFSATETTFAGKGGVKIAF